MSRFLEIARAHWPDPVPDWIEVLATQCDLLNQARVAERIGYSGGLVSSVLRNRYAGNMEAVEDAVRGAWMNSRVECPVMGMIGTDVCASWRRKAKRFEPTNNHRVRMYRACQSCPRNNREGV